MPQSAPRPVFADCIELSIFGYKEYNQSDLNKCDLIYTVRPGTNCGSDHELLIAKFRLKLKTVGKTTIPFRYDLNQILYDYTVEVTNRFKGLDLIDRVPEERWTKVHDII